MSDIVKLMFIVLVMLNRVSTAGSSLCVDEVFDLIFRDKSAIDYVVSGKTVQSRAECSVLCHQEEGCVSMAYSGSGECVLHGELPQTLTVVSNQDTDIYYRQGAVPHSTTSASATTSPMIVTTTAIPTTPTTNATPLTTFEEPSPSSTVNAATPLTTPVGSTTTPPASTMTSPMTNASTVTVTTTPATSTSTSTTTTTITTTPTTTTTSSITTTPTTITSLTTTTTTTASTTTTTAATPSTTSTTSTSTTQSTTTTTPTTSLTTTTASTASSSSTTTTTTATTTTTTPSTTTTSTPTTSTTTTTPTSSLTTTTAATSQLVELWATAVLAFSSEENPEGNNAASQVIGEPDVYPDHGHNVKAWGQSDINNDHQYVQLKYAMKLFISEVHVYETHRAGATWLVEILTPSGEYVTMYRAKRLYRLSSSRIVELVLIHLTSFTSDVIRVWVDPSYAGGSVEIDAVKLVGMTDPNQQ